MWQLAKSDYLKLLLIMALAFYMTFLPHLNYPYPIHIDDWVHLAYAKALVSAGNIDFVEPFSGTAILGVISNPEVGFHLFWGTFQRLSGLSWLTIFRYFPGVVFILTILGVYILCRRMGFGWEAAFFTSLIPTTVGILGPAFLVPVAMGLLFVPLSLFVAFYFKTIWSYLILFIFTSFLMAIHAPSAILSVMILVPYIFLNLKGNFRHSLSLMLALGLPFLVALPWIADLIVSTAKLLLVVQPLPAYHDLPSVVRIYGFVPIGLSLLGTCWLAFKGGIKEYGLVLGLLITLLMLATFYTFHYGVSLIYLRGLLFMTLILGIVAGAGLKVVKTLEIPVKWGVLRLAKKIGYLLSFVLIVVTLLISIPTRQQIPYYRMIDDYDYEAFVWIKDNVGDNYKKAIVDPWKATAFTAITGKYIYSRIHMAPTPEDERAYQFLRSGSTDTAFLKGNGISIVYTREPVSNPDLMKVRENVYLLGVVRNP